MVEELVSKQVQASCNFVFSPLLLQAMLSLVSAGSSGGTLRQLLWVLKLIYIHERIKGARDSSVTLSHLSGSLDKEAALIFVNAMYFKGTWARRFKASKTETWLFHLNGEIMQGPFIRSKKYEKHLYKSFANDFKILKLSQPKSQGLSPLCNVLLPPRTD
ncbi:Serpin domain [Dillenia turbinata]|uniref:Serpin domain n=1 Tax=Dillenia turbinata TaxID=194707 RepID=A0AAN8WD86_9MAGN